MDEQRPPLPPAGDVRRAWGRITGWLERHSPAVFASLGGPGDPAALAAAEERMGVRLPEEMRQWLLANDVGPAGRSGDTAGPLASGREGVLPDGGLLLGLAGVERVHLHMTAAEESEPSGDPGHPSWRREWVPVSSESDGFHGRFLDARTGRVGRWSEGSGPVEGEYASLSAFFDAVADRLEGIPPEDRSGTPDGPVRVRGHDTGAIRRWARAHGHPVNDRGRIPASVVDAYVASL
ncbi:histone-like nucleoid-structuring protein Lsr2 [Streptomyces sp. NPDC001744]|uniref:Lsr2 family DNA-binding protein n=1 Tax=Streptomyces sp. NPDC001744 TaxID=3364606 RepID=UPI00368D8528